MSRRDLINQQASVLDTQRAWHEVDPDLKDSVAAQLDVEYRRYDEMVAEAPLWQRWGIGGPAQREHEDRLWISSRNDPEAEL